MAKAGYVGNQPVRESQAESYPGAWTGQEQYQEIRNNNWPKPIYEVERSIRLNSEDATFFSRTPASASNRKTWTWSGWVKRSAIAFSAEQHIWGVTGTTDATYGEMFFGTGDTLRFAVGYNTTYGITTTRVFRDASAWYHIVLAFDATQSTAANKIKLYINGVEETTFSSDTRSSLANQDWGYNNNVAHYIGRQANSAIRHFNGYLANIHFIDGQALTPSAFATTDPDTNQWVPKKYANSYGYGPNGFWLKFADNSAATAATLGKDSSPSGNNWTPNNFSINTGEAVPVATATGGIPIHNTTDTFGATIGSGVRTDVNASTLVLAAPLTTAGSNGLSDDESPAGRVSSTKTLTANGSITSSTSIAKYYGGAASFAAGGYYQLSSSDFTFGTGDFTIEAWVYNPSTTSGSLFATNTNSLATTTFNARFYGNTQTINVYTSGGSDYITVTQVPVNQWVHIAMCRSGGSTMRVFINGVLRATSFGWAASLTDSDQFFINTGRDGSGARYYQDVRVYKGLAKYSADFIVPDSAPKPLISAGNDSLVDTPTSYGTDTGAGGEVRGNYATLNPLDNGGGLTLSNGNLEAENTAASSKGARCTIKIPSTGKWYFEGTIQTLGGSCALGVATSASANPSLSATGTWHILNYAGSGIQSYPGGRGYTFTTAEVGNVLQVAYDADSGKLWFGVNNTWCDGSSGSTGNPGAGTNPTYTSVSDVFPAVEQYTSKIAINFGQRPFAYTAPSGFKALCDTNLPAPVVAKPNTVMDVKLYTGTGSNQAVTGLGFSPDFVWIKRRNLDRSHMVFDAVRGLPNRLATNETSGDNTDANNLVSFDSTGFTTSTGDAVNGSGGTYVGWCWDAGSSTVTNTQGSITTSLRASASSGFSVISYTGTGSAGASIGHGLGVAPAFALFKNRSTSSDWQVYHVSLGNAQSILLQSTAAAGSSSAFNSTSPTSTVITLGAGTSLNNNGSSHICYAWAPVAGYSSMGSYVGDGSTSGFGPFIHCGFRPKFVLIKGPSLAYDWLMLDSVRNPYNLTTQVLYANSSIAEMTNNGAGSGGYESIDILSNGFQIKSNSARYNQSGATYIYFAVAESPFAYSRAR